MIWFYWLYMAFSQAIFEFFEYSFLDSFTPSPVNMYRSPSLIAQPDFFMTTIQISLTLSAAQLFARKKCSIKTYDASRRFSSLTIPVTPALSLRIISPITITTNHPNAVPFLKQNRNSISVSFAHFHIFPLTCRRICATICLGGHPRRFYPFCFFANHKKYITSPRFCPLHFCELFSRIFLLTSII